MELVYLTDMVASFILSKETLEPRVKTEYFRAGFNTTCYPLIWLFICHMQLLRLNHSKITPRKLFFFSCGNVVFTVLFYFIALIATDPTNWLWIEVCSYVQTLAYFVLQFWALSLLLL